MSLVRSLVCLALAFGLIAAPWSASAQSTDGYHAIQVLPVVVDTASFTQGFDLNNAAGLSAVLITPTYYPATGTAELSPSTCPSFSINPRRDVSFTSLRQICPGLAPGSMFGTLVLSSGSSQPFAVYSRVSNASGAGFSVEGFPANAFGSSASIVTGLRRSASTPSAPAYQTNCFVGNLGEVTPDPSPVATPVTVWLTENHDVIGSTVVAVAPGHLVRLLDVFAAVGDANNEYTHAVAEFTAFDGGGGGLISFCTVQDNTSFGADFRIGKHEEGEFSSQVSHDLGNWRSVGIGGTPQFEGLVATGSPFAIPAGASGNTHVFYFHHPDYVGCSIVDPTTHAPANPSYGLEMRLITYSAAPGNFEVVAGGNGTTSFSDLYLGDRNDHPGGNNTVYYLQVESNGQNEAANRPYELQCQSGSGHNMGELIQTGAAVSF